MLELFYTPDNNLEVKVLDRKAFKEIAVDDDHEEVLTDLIEASGYFSFKVEEGLNNAAGISSDGKTYIFKQDVRPVISELNKYGFAIFKKQ